jgi:hypothetical protein
MIMALVIITILTCLIVDLIADRRAEGGEDRARVERGKLPTGSHQAQV